MTYVHTGAKTVILKQDPIDADGTDWFYFSYGAWLRPDETITAHSAVVVGGIKVTDSTYLGTMTDTDGTVYQQVYGVECSVTAGATQLEITHRVSTATTGGVDLGRTNIDRTAIVPVVKI